jgi:hypothetical protein
MRKFEIEVDYELADKITINVLTEYRNSLVESLDGHLNHGEWLHVDDVPHMKQMISAIDFVLKDFGVENGEDFNTDEEAS